MNPPKLPLRFLEWFCPDDLYEGILGDLEEKFEEDRNLKGLRTARRNFRWNVLRLFHPSIFLRNKFRLIPGTTALLYRHVQTTSRQMRRNPFFTIITLSGLSVTLAFVFMALLFIQKERSFDQFHSGKDNIYRIYQDFRNAETGISTRRSAVTPVPLAKDLASNLPGIKAFTRIGSSPATVFKNQDPFTETLHFVDPGFLLMFDFPMLQGDRIHILGDPLDLVISRDIANKYFGNNDPVGQEMRLALGDTAFLMKVQGVIDPLKARSSLPFDFLLPLEQYKWVISTDLFESYAYGLVENYILLDSGKKLQDIITPMQSALDQGDAAANQQVYYGLQPLPSIHLTDDITGNAQYTSPQKLYFLMMLSVLVIVIACINFIILSTSQALGRFREIGVRKTLGAKSLQLWWQLMVESTLVSFFPAIIATGIAWQFTPLFGRLTGDSLSFDPGIEITLLVFGIALLVAWVTSLLASRIILRSRVQDALSGRNKFGRNRNVLNDGLIVMQFALSMLLVLGAITIRRQMQYIQHKDLGFNQERLLEIALPLSASTTSNRMLVDRFAALVQTNNQILSVSASMNNSRDPWTELAFEQADGSSEKIAYNQIDPNYLKTMDIELLDGQNFKAGSQNNVSAILVNETLVKHFQWDQPLTHTIPGKNFTGNQQIVGVVRDFHFNSLHQQIPPLILSMDLEPLASGITGLSTYVWPSNLYQILVRIGPGDLNPVLGYLENTWKSILPDQPFNYQFVDEVLADKYAEELRWGKALNWASLFAIGIAWLGLLSLMRLSVKKKTREIGIRKVLGSSSSAVMVLLSRKFILLVATGSLVAWPLAWIILDQWLNSFSYHISINPLTFFLVAIAVLMFTTASIGIQSLLASRANPVESLKQD